MPTTRLFFLGCDQIADGFDEAVRYGGGIDLKAVLGDRLLDLGYFRCIYKRGVNHAAFQAL